MNPAQLRTVIERNGGVVATLLDGEVRDDDIDHEELSEEWYELQSAYDRLEMDAAGFMGNLYDHLDEDGPID